MNNEMELGNKRLASDIKLCSLPWSQISSSPTGTMIYCCEASTVYEVNGTDVNYKEFWNSAYLKNVRQALARGEMNKYCRNCAEKEQKGLPSTRTSSLYHADLEELRSQTEQSLQNQGETSATPSQIDIRFSTKCNMKCRMCNPYNSSEIYKEFLANREELVQNKLDFGWAGADKYYGEFETRWNLQDLFTFCKTPKRVIISGGEPFLQKDFFEMMRLLIEGGQAQHIDLQITTNGSVYPHKIEETLSRFKSVSLLISVDGIGQVYDYIRYPFRWSYIEKQILRFHALRSNTISVRLSPTIQALNLLGLCDLIQWCLDYKVDFELHTSVVDPAHMSIDIVPIEIRTKISQELNALKLAYSETSKQFHAIDNLALALTQPSPKSFMESSELKNVFLKHMDALDRIRKQSLKADLPDLYQILQADIQKPWYQIFFRTRN